MIQHTYIFYRYNKTLDTFNVYLITFSPNFLGYAFLIVWFTALMTRLRKKGFRGCFAYLKNDVVCLNLKRSSAYNMFIQTIVFLLNVDYTCGLFFRLHKCSIWIINIFKLVKVTFYFLFIYMFSRFSYHTSVKLEG